jgi:serine/threonine protein kinase
MIIYSSPEVMRNAPMSKENDLWAIGMIAFLLLWGYLPFPRESKYWEAGFAFTVPTDGVDVSANARDFVSHLLCLNAPDRMTAAAALRHPWITARADVLEQNSLPAAFEELNRAQERRRRLQRATRIIRDAIRFRLKQTTTTTTTTTTKTTTTTTATTTAVTNTTKAKKRKVEVIVAAKEEEPQEKKRSTKRSKRN